MHKRLTLKGESTTLFSSMVNKCDAVPRGRVHHAVNGASSQGISARCVAAAAGAKRKQNRYTRRMRNQKPQAKSRAVSVPHGCANIRAQRAQLKLQVMHSSLLCPMCVLLVLKMQILGFSMSASGIDGHGYITTSAP